MSEPLALFASSGGVLLAVVHSQDLSSARAVVAAAREAAVLPAESVTLTVRCPRRCPPLGLARAVAHAAARNGAREPAEDTFRALADSVLALPAAPLVLFVDDAHEADEGSLSWIAHVLRRAAHRAACVVLTHLRDPGAAVSALLGTVLGDGIGFAVAVEVPAGTSPRDAGRPADAATRVVLAAAVLPAEDVNLVAALARVPTEDAAALMAADSEGGAASRAAPAKAGPLEASRLRRQAARLLNDAGSTAELVARHLLELPELRESWMRTALSDAAAEAARRGAPETAVRYLAALVDSDLLDAGDVHLRLGELLTDTDPARAVDLLGTALTGAADLRDGARIALRFALAALAARRSAVAVEILEPLVARLADAVGPAPDGVDRELLQTARSAFLIVCFDGMDTVRRAHAFLRTVPEPVARTDGDRQLLAMMAVADVFAGVAPEQAVERAERALLLDEDDLGGWSALASAFALGVTGRLERGMAALDAMVHRSGAAGRTWIRCLALGTRAMLATGAGDFSGVAADSALALAIARRESWHADLVMPTVGLSVALVHQGRAEEADRMLADLACSHERLQSAVLEKHTLLMARAAARAHLGDADGALRHLHACGSSLDQAGVRNPLFMPWWAEAALLLAHQDRPAEATSLVERGEELTRTWPVPRAEGLVLLTRAAVSPCGRAIELLEEAVALLDTPDSRYDLHRAHRALGTALAAAGDYHAARAHLHRATAVAVACAARPAATACRELLRKAGGRVAVEHRPQDTLSAMEQRIARLAASGETNREIAAALYLSTRSVELHLTSAYRKLGVGGRPGLGAALRGDAGRQAAS